jgi:hypothetical protein
MEVYSAQRQVHPATPFVTTLALLAVASLMAFSMVAGKSQNWSATEGKWIQIRPGQSIQIPASWVRLDDGGNHMVFGPSPKAPGDPICTIWRAPFEQITYEKARAETVDRLALDFHTRDKEIVFREKSKCRFAGQEATIAEVTPKVDPAFFNTDSLFAVTILIVPGANESLLVAMESEPRQTERSLRLLEHMARSAGLEPQ